MSELQKIDNLENYFKSLLKADGCKVYVDFDEKEQRIFSIGVDYLEIGYQTTSESKTIKMKIILFSSIQTMELSTRHTEGGLLNNGKSFYTLRIDINKSTLLVEEKLNRMIYIYNRKTVTSPKVTYCLE